MFRRTRIIRCLIVPPARTCIESRITKAASAQIAPLPYFICLSTRFRNVRYDPIVQRPKRRGRVFARPVLAKLEDDDLVESFFEGDGAAVHAAEGKVGGKVARSGTPA